MSRLIDADALAEDLLYDAELCAIALDSGEITDHKELARLQFEKDCKQNCVYYISESPTVDAVEVCRCKDCRYSREPNRYDRDENAACEGVLICCVGFDHVYPSSDDGLLFVDKNGYCCHGERKGGDE